MTTSWKIKILIPIIYFIATLILFYIVTSYNGFHINKIETIGIILVVISFTFWILSRIQLANSFSVSPEAKKLIKSGIYSKIRHPIYIFSFFYLLGLFLFLNNLILLLLLIPILLLQLFRMGKEEKILLKKFGNEYTNYKKSSWF